MASLSDFQSDIPTALYPAVEAFHRTPNIVGATFDPAALTWAVNTLWQFGKAAALDAAQAYLTLATTDAARAQQHGLNAQRIFLALRLLFVRQDGNAKMPRLFIGAPDGQMFPLEEAEDAWPLFPLVLTQNIPFLLVGEYGTMLGGHPQSPQDHITFCRDQCRLRDDLLKEAALPTEAVKILCVSEPWRRLFREEGSRSRYEVMLFGQARRAVSFRGIGSD